MRPRCGDVTQTPFFCAVRSRLTATGPHRGARPRLASPVPGHRRVNATAPQPCGSSGSTSSAPCSAPAHGSPPSSGRNTTAGLFAGFLGLLLQQVGKPPTVILNNASVHTAKVIAPLVEQLKKKACPCTSCPLQPRAQPHRDPLAQSQVPVDDVQDPRLQNTGRRPRRHLCQIRPSLPVDFLRFT